MVLIATLIKPFIPEDIIGILLSHESKLDHQYMNEMSANIASYNNNSLFGHGSKARIRNR